MANVISSIDIDRPVRTVYNQWTQFEEFPKFMEGVEEVRQLDDATLAWKARIAGIEREWTARIVEQEPDQAVAWESTSGTRNNGRVTFEPLGPRTTRVNLAIDLEPKGPFEKAGEALGLIERRAEDDLKRFRDFIEERPRETGGWRGEIHDMVSDDSSSSSTSSTGSRSFPALAALGLGGVIIVVSLAAFRRRTRAQG